MLNKQSIVQSMKNVNCKSFTIFFLLLSLFTIQASAQQSIIPRPPQIAATSYILMDAKTGEILVEENADIPLPPASLTKIMTSYVAAYELEQGTVTLDDTVHISVKAWQMEGSKMFIQEGTEVRFEDLLRGMIIQSGNDASVAIAEHIAGSEEAFADMMNQHAEILGLDNTYFLNASGLPDALHTMSARDLSLLSKAMIQRFPEHYSMYAEREFTFNEIRQPNRNSLLFRDRNVDGIKTGFTDEAGYCLVASATRDDMRLIAVVMGTNSTDARAIESQKLLTYGFRFYQTLQLFENNEVLSTDRVWSGRTNAVDIGIADEVYVTIPRGQEDNLQTDLVIEESLKAPITAGQVLGNVIISLADIIYYDGPVVAMEVVERGSFIKRLMDFLHLFFISLFS
ncbi:MAG: D-alanyl-D-alanine carboxypeptidase [Gammaproteobacteria bacterium]|nr:D-alanyl-D-alanine carboxypeptidase [Gammaproteobacteria bacterium]